MWFVPDSTEQFWTAAFWDAPFWPENADNGIINTSTTSLVSGDVLLVPSYMWMGSSINAWRMTTSFVVESSLSQTGDETTIVPHGRPVIELTIENGALRGSSSALRAWARRAAKARTLLPLLPDTVELTASASIGDTSLSVSSNELTRFTKNIRVAIVQYTNNQLTDFETAVVSSVPSSNSILLTTALTKSWDSCARVIPLVECLPPQLQTDAVSRDVLLLSGSARSSNNAAAYPPLTTIGSNPTNYPTLSDLPIFQVPGVRSESDTQWGVSFHGSSSDLGADVTFDRLNTDPREQYQILSVCKNRQQWFDITNFYHSRAGTAYRFWLLSAGHPFRDVEIIDTSTIRVAHYGDADDWADVKGIGVVATNGKKAYGEIDSITVGSNTDEVTFKSTALDVLQKPDTSFYEACGAFELILCRFSGPMRESWISKDIIEVETPAIRSSQSVSAEIDVEIPSVLIDSCLFALKDCDGVEPDIITSSDLADLSAVSESSLAEFVDATGASNDKSLKFSEDGTDSCWTVVSIASGTPTTVTVTESFASCEDCSEEPSSCSCPISSQQAQDLENGTVQSVVGSDGNTYCRDYKVTFTNTKYVGSPIDCSSVACQDIGVVLWVRAKYTQTGNDTTCNWEYLCGGETDTNGDPVNCGDYTTASLSLVTSNDPDCYWAFGAGGNNVKRRDPAVEGAYEDNPTCSDYINGGGGGFNYDRLTNVSVVCDNDPNCPEEPAPCTCPISQADWDDLVDGVKDSVTGTNGETYYRRYDVTYDIAVGNAGSCSECSQSVSIRVAADSKTSRCTWAVIGTGGQSSSFSAFDCDGDVTIVSSSAELDLSTDNDPDCAWRLTFSTGGHQTGSPFFTGGINGPASEADIVVPESGSYPDTICGGTGGGRLSTYEQKATNISVAAVV